MGDPETWRHTIGPLARRQHGHVRRSQLLAIGMPATTIARWVRDGKLISIHLGVYALSYRRDDPTARAAAAVLVDRDAVLSHDSAAALWGLRRWPATPEITSPRKLRRSRIRSHICTTMPPGDITRHWGIRVTTPYRTLTDIWPRLTNAQRKRQAADARLQHLISIDQAQQLLGHRRNPTRSGGEDRLEQLLLDDDEIPPFHTNTTVAGREADFWFPDRKVVVELDHPDTHLDVAADRRTDRRRAARQILTLRFDYDDLDFDPAATVVEIKQILAGRANRS